MTPTTKIAIIGAGGFVFPFRLIGDLLSFPALRSAELCLMDVNPDKLAPVADATRKLVAHHGFDSRVVETTDRRAALTGADFVIITFQVGGVESYRRDVEIPRRYGVDQTVGDTVGPGGVFRFLRSVPAYRAIAADALEVCPDAVFINYANPMAMATGYLNALGLKTVGLCHSVQGTTRMLARTLGVPYDQVSYVCAGINHQAWVLTFRRGDRVWVFLAGHERPTGTAQEFTNLPADRVVRLPAGTSFDIGASLGVPAMTAHRALTVSEDGPVRLHPSALAGKVVLVAGGAGAVGHAAIQLARWAGATVITTVSGPAKGALATAAGAHQVINYRDDDAATAIAKVAPDGVDLVVEVAAAANSQLNIDVVKPRAS